MDPITALQTASAIIGIVDFGTRLLSSTYEIYHSKSGHTAHEVGLSTLSDELNGLGKQLQDRLQAAPSTASASNRTLQNLSARCVEVSDKLHSAINDLQASQSGNSRISTAANSFASALKAVWRKGEVESLRGELIEIRSQITFAAIVSVLVEPKQDGQRHMELKDRLDQITKKLDGRDDTTHQFAKELAQMTALGNSNPISRRHTDLVDMLWGMDWKSWQASNSGNLFIDVQSAPHTHINGAFIPMKILTSLSFQEINSREEAVPEAYASTFSWIFRDSEDDENGKQLEWPSFPTWLKQRDQEIYWITGKLGSGKSTLMKYIIENPNLRTHLQDYAGDLPYLKASFFFWNPGSEMEKSQEGLLRTLLHQCLKARPELTPIVAPRRWALYTLLGGEAVPPEWTWKELQESFDILCSLHGQKFRLVIFIDGLDEFKEAETSPRKLIDWIHHTATHYGIKMCISSRPWNVFADAFGRKTPLTMQNLTKRDIEHFVRAEFDESNGFQELKKIFEDEPESIIKKIIEKAQGVFLWVGLVVQNLLSTLVDNPSLGDLELMLDEIPSDMAGLYTAIWRSIPAKRQRRSSKILQICVDSWSPCTAEIMWLATEENPNPQAVTSPGIQNLMKRVLDGHTRGMCELVRGQVQFLHRSAAEWVSEDSTRAEICSKAPQDFESRLNLLEAYLQYHTVTKGEEPLNDDKLSYMAQVLFMNITELYCTASPDRISQLRVRLIQAVGDVNRLGYYSTEHPNPIAHRRRPTTRNLAPELPEGWSTEHRLGQNTATFFCTETCFVGCAASAGFVDYVKEKLRNDPSFLVPKRKRMPILENAIFMEYDTANQKFWPSSSPIEYCYQKGRLEIIRFILEESPHWYKTADDKHMYETASSFLSTANSEAAEWRREVLELLQEFGYESYERWKRNPNHPKAAVPDNKKASRKPFELLRGLKNELGVYFGTKARVDRN